MKSSIQTFLLPLVAVAILMGCDSVHKKEVAVKNINVDSLINQIVKDSIPELIGLNSYKDYVEICNNPNPYFGEIKTYIENFRNLPELKDESYSNNDEFGRKANDQEFTLAFMTMHNLNIDDYINLCNLAFALYNEHLISHHVLDVTVCGYDNHSPILQHRYNSKVKNFIQNITDNPSLSDEKEHLIRLIEKYSQKK